MRKALKNMERFLRAAVQRISSCTHVIENGFCGPWNTELHRIESWNRLRQIEIIRTFLSDIQIQILCSLMCVRKDFIGIMGFRLRFTL